MKDERLSGALQENVLTLLCFSDEFCKLVRYSITPSLFESSVFKDIANHAIDFIDQYGTAIKEHLPDSMESILKGSDKRKAASYERTVDNLFASRESVNGEYVVSKLHEFVRQQQLKSSVVAAVAALEDGRVAQAEVELQKGLRNQAMSFEAGTTFGDPSQSLKFFDHQADGILTGIGILDAKDICPRPQEVLLLIAPPKKGKSWFLIHLGKWALLQRRSVLHITLEMSERRVSQRYIQSFFSVSKRQAEVRTTVFKRDKDGTLLDIDFDTVKRKTLADPKIKEYLAGRLTKEFKNKKPLIIKQFPTGTLTISMLKAYLDGLERFHKFTPDIILIDYPDLMAVDQANLRTDLGQIFKEVRGIAVERNVAIATVTQGNRESSRARVVTDAHVAEDYSKIATADNVLTYNQTEAEKNLGLARIFVSNGRNDEDKFMVLMSQSYSIGQFCLDSALMTPDYWGLVDTAAGGKPEDSD